MFCKDFQRTNVFKNNGQKAGFGIGFSRPNRWKIDKKIAFKINAFWDVVFKVILNGFGRGLGRVWEAMLATFLDVFATFGGFFTIW